MNDDDQQLKARIATALRDYRRIKNLSQAELARRIGVRPGPLNTIEQGRHVPSGRLLLKLADALDVTVDDILGRTAAPGTCREERPRYLAHDGAERRDIRPCAQPMILRDDLPLDIPTRRRLDRLVREYLDLEDRSGAQKFAAIPLRCPFTVDDRGIELLAQQVRHFLGIGGAVIFDYLQLLENAGLRVVFCALPETHGSVAYFDEANANVFFFINETNGVERQLFELIKRLGAVYWHTGGAKEVPDTGPHVIDSLRMARKFAAFFLMPEAAMRATVAQTGMSADHWKYELVLRLKHRFGVSAESFVIRLEELQLVTPELARRYKARIWRDYKKTKYKEPDGSRRILTPNGRLDDLRLVTGRRRG